MKNKKQTSLYEELKNLWNNNTLRAGIILIVGVLTAFAFLSLAVRFILNIFKFVTESSNLYTNLAFVSVIVFLSMLLKIRNTDKKTNVPTNAIVDRQTVEHNYEVLRCVLFQILPDIGETVHIQTASTYSELDAPVKYVKRDGVIFYKFLCTKSKAEIDVKIVRDVLQNRIRQRLMAKEIDGINAPTSHLYNGVAYPRIIVDSVSNSEVYVEITLVFASDSYIEQIQQQKLYTYELSKIKNNTWDNDF